MAGRFSGSELTYVLEVLDSGWLSSESGRMTERFERAFAGVMGARHAVMLLSTQAAMQAALSAAGVGPGDEVITDPAVWFSTQAILYANAVPVYADVQRESFTIDPASIRERLTPRTRAIICTHLFGLPCDMDEINAIARDRELMVIEDCAQAIRAEYNGKCVGSLGNAGCFCLHDSKQFSTGGAGMATTQSDALAEEIRLHCEGGLIDAPSRGVGLGRRGCHVGFKLRSTELQAAVGLAQLERLEELLRPGMERARTATEVWREIMGDTPFLVPQEVASHKTHTYWHYACRYDGERFGVPFEAFKRAAEQGDWGLGFGYGWSVYQQPRVRAPLIYSHGCPTHCPHYTGQLHYEEGLCPVGEWLFPRLVAGVGGGNKDAIAEKARRVTQEFRRLRAGKGGD